MKYIVNGKIILPNGILENKALVYTDKIVDIIDRENVPAQGEIIDADGGYVSPGLIDIHIHGYLGADTMDGTPEAIKTIANGIVKNGVTAWCPTTMTVSMDEITKTLGVVRELKTQSKSWDGAEILGVHLEGPFINPQKKGAQPLEYILPLDSEFIIKNSDIIVKATVAPELYNNTAEIKKICEKCDTKISIGHTTATFEETLKAIDAGATQITHTFNAQSGLNHRNPGVVGAALLSDVYTELICDTFHIHKSLFSLVAKLKGDKLVLITDCTEAGGMPDGEYTLGNQKFQLRGITCLLDDGTIAGSVLKLNQAVKNVRDNTDLPLYEIVKAATLNPAKAINRDDRKGSLEKGKDADIIITDNDFNVLKTIIGGVLKYQR